MRLTGFMILVALLPTAEAQTSRPTKKRAAADLGLETRYPTPDEVKRLKLPRHVRVLGQVVSAVTPKGPADRAGLRVGDVIFKLGDNQLYSRDDVRDYQSIVGQPSTRIVARVRRAETGRIEEVPITLGRREVRVTPGLRWRFAGRGQLPPAKAEAKRKLRWLLIGLSGSDT